MTPEHKKAIAASKIGKKHLDSTRQKISQSRLKFIASRTEEWVLIDNNNKIVKVKSLRQFCLNNNLSYSALRKKHQSNDGRPILSGPSKGWRVYGRSKSH